MYMCENCVSQKRRRHNFRGSAVLLTHLGEEISLIHWERVKTVHCASIQRPGNPMNLACD